jgi:hypothetical protein
MGLRRMKGRTPGWRLVQRYEAMKKGKGSGQAIIAMARKIAVVIWNMITKDAGVDIGLMLDRKLTKKSEGMSGLAGTAGEAADEEQEKPVIAGDKKKGSGVKKYKGIWRWQGKKKKAG